MRGKGEQRELGSPQRKGGRSLLVLTISHRVGCPNPSLGLFGFPEGIQRFSIMFLLVFPNNGSLSPLCQRRRALLLLPGKRLYAPIAASRYHRFRFVGLPSNVNLVKISSLIELESRIIHLTPVTSFFLQN